jgi:uncharacterized protein YbjT (DUF2867 family)
MNMKIVVIGGRPDRIQCGGQASPERPRVLAAAPDSGINTITGEGLAGALTDAEVVVDVANSPSFEHKAVMDFFQTSGRNLLAAEAEAGVKHHVALSVVGADRLPESGYLRAKVAQEKLIKASGIPYTILHSTQFFEFIGRIADAAADGNAIRLSPALLQPIAADDVAAALADLALGQPLNGIVEVAGPDAHPLDKLGTPLRTTATKNKTVISLSAWVAPSRDRLCCRDGNAA